jgi:flagellar basal body rod protein FlgC
MKIINIGLLMFFISCSHQKVSSKQILNFCQDLNVLYQKIEVYSSNLVNINTTRTLAGGYYKRLILRDCKHGICKVVKDTSPPILRYEPDHPDSNQKGYVEYPNINSKIEEFDILNWKKVYEMVIENSPVPSNFFFKDSRAKLCFEKYPALKERRDFSNYLGRNLLSRDGKSYIKEPSN